MPVSGETGARVTDFITDLREALEEAGDPARAEQQRAYLKSEMAMYGVGVPETRRLSQRIAVAHRGLWTEAATWEAALRCLWDGATHREERYAALVVREHPAAAARMRVWATDPDVWVRRSAIICQLQHKAGTDLDLLTAVIEANQEDSEFFIRKAVGWALRDYARTDGDWVRAFVQAHPDLSPLSRREALKRL